MTNGECGFPRHARQADEAAGARRIDVPPSTTQEPDFSIWQKVHPYETNSGTGGIWGELYGSEVNHSTLVWYMQEEAVQWLG